jgi:hypothetical protein
MEDQVITKKDSNTISVVKSVPVQFDFTPEYLKKQIENIKAQKDRDNAQRDLEISECEAYLAECVKLDVVEKPIEVVPVEAIEDKEINSLEK